MSYDFLTAAKVWPRPSRARAKFIGAELFVPFFFLSAVRYVTKAVALVRVHNAKLAGLGFVFVGWTKDARSPRAVLRLKSVIVHQFPLLVVVHRLAVFVSLFCVHLVGI